MGEVIIPNEARNFSAVYCCRLVVLS